MAIAPNASATETNAVLAAATARDFTIPLYGSSRVSIAVKNTGGTNAIETCTVHVSPLGALEGEVTAASTALATLAVGVCKVAALDAGPLASVRLRVTSASGSTVSIEVRGH
jgi:hypothetical protein